jgi:hypothetical protein
VLIYASRFAMVRQKYAMLTIICIVQTLVYVEKMRSTQRVGVERLGKFQVGNKKQRQHHTGGRHREL